MTRTLTPRREFLLPKKIDRYLGALSELYGQEGERLLQEILVNGKLQITEEFSYDNWDGGVWGHAVNFVLTDAIFFRALKDREVISKRIAKDINDLNVVSDEFIDQVTFEIDDVELGDWRSQSGLMQVPGRIVATKSAERIWKRDRYRIFLSHKSEVKAETAILKTELDGFGATCFVAHEDIHPTQEWQEEIENALATADAFVALITKSFHESAWTNQEIGYALSRGIPMVSIRLGSDPQGFIGRTQALACSWKDAPLEVAKLLAHQDRMVAGFLQALRDCKSFNQANRLADLLKHLSKMSQENADEMLQIYNSNDEVRGGFGFNGTKPTIYGAGLANHLNRLTGSTYVYGESRRLSKI